MSKLVTDLQSISSYTMRLRDFEHPNDPNTLKRSYSAASSKTSTKVYSLKENAVDQTDTTAPETRVSIGESNENFDVGHQTGTTEFDPHAIWQMLLSELSLQMPSATYNTWVRDTWVITYEDGEFIIGLPNAYARDWLENRLRHKIKRVLSSLIHRSVQVQFRVCPRPVSDLPNVAPTPFYQTIDHELPTYEYSPLELSLPNREQTPSPIVTSGGYQSKGRAQEAVRMTRSQLNSYYTFDSFIVGSHNKLAHAAAEAIAERPGQSFNPLFVYGGVGLGKTHLLHAIGQRALQLGYRMLYCSSKQFTNELISAIRNQNTDEFRNKYRQVDILLIDDIQFIAGKESIQEEFFHTFNYLHASGRQVVLSSDRPPKALATLDDRLRSRFEDGLQTDIFKPDFETRVAILQSKAKRMGATVDPSVLMMIAERVDSNIRELEGALNRLTIQARLVNSPLNLSLATVIMDNLAPERTPCTPDALVRLVATHFQLKAEDLTGRIRSKEIAHARQIAMFLLREEHALSLPAIGDQLGGRDHSTVRYGIEKVAADLNEDEALRQTITILREKIYVSFAEFALSPNPVKAVETNTLQLAQSSGGDQEFLNTDDVDHCVRNVQKLFQKRAQIRRGDAPKIADIFDSQAEMLERLL